MERPPSYVEIPPPAGIETSVECLWTVTTFGCVATWPVLPDGCVDLIFSEPEGLRAAGAMTSARSFTLPAHGEVIGIRFHPGGSRAAVGLPLAELTDRIVGATDLWGRAGGQFEERLGGATRAERLRLLASIAGRCDQIPPATRAVRTIVRQHGEVDLDWAARQANSSPRHFRRVCVQETGLSPKRLCRILRFRRAVTMIDSGVSCAALAAECGYFDQSHLINDFRELAGCTPGEYARTRRATT